MTDWLPEGHLAWFVIDTVAVLDTSVLHERAAARRDGTPARSTAGRAGYDPDMLLALLIYGYACGERSSRRIERLCTTDVAFRVICAGDVPDHTVISRFRQTHADSFVELFAQVLRLCRAAGLAQLGTVAIDGTKIAANASRLANRSHQWLVTEVARLDQAPDPAVQGGAVQGGAVQGGAVQGDREQVEAILADAERVDAAENAAFGTGARGDELPVGWAGRDGRQARIRAALARIEAEQTARESAERAESAARTERDTAALARAQAALAAELAARQAARDAWEQQWEKAMTTPGTPLPRGAAPQPAEDSAAVRRARQRVERARQRVTHPDTAPRPGGSRPHPDRRGRRDLNPEPRGNLTDPDSSIMPSHNGWVQGYNTQLAVTADQVILGLHVSTNPADIISFTPMLDTVTTTAATLEATDELGTLLLDTGYCSNDTLTAPGPDRLIATGTTRSIRQAARDHPAAGPPPGDTSPREAMDHRLRTPEGAQLYTRRGATVEPGIGNFKKLLARFSRRGLTAATSEAHLAATAFNLLKIHRATPA